MGGQIQVSSGSEGFAMTSLPQTTRQPLRRGRGPASVLTPRSRRLLVTVHVLAAVGLFGADLALVALGSFGAGGAAPQAVYPAMSLLAQWLVVPLAFAALGSGLLLGALGRWSLLRHGWVAVKLAITVALAAALVVVLVSDLNAAAAAATAELPVPQRLLFAISPAAASILLTVSAVLGKYKPHRRARTPGFERRR
jgi:hypothetical protein